PQFVTATLDDAVNVLNIVTYRDILYGRRNKNNNCPAGFSFYVSHEYTDYTLVNELYNNGFEIALHSITHLTNQTYWAAGTYETMVQEFAEQRVQMAHFANIP
ncbi:hypothetical protein H4F36_24220, partial [Escherichia coli]|nr:hypothetical protein [Escherichia coli]